VTASDDRDDGPTARAAGRRAFLDRGARAERAVAAHLEASGLEILATNLRVGRLELDVVARDDRVIAIVEVRARGPGSWLLPLDSVDAKKRARVRRAGEQLWRDRFAHDARVDRMRFDLAAVTIDDEGAETIEIVKAAF
jgi:putative endonuclease